MTFHHRIAHPSPLPGRHPAGTAATPVEMPMARVSWDGHTAEYEALFPQPGPDGKYAHYRAYWGGHEVIPAGRP